MSCEYSQSLWVDLGNRVREGDDMNCSYCGCLLPDEYHPNCKQCGGPRKAATECDFSDSSTYYSPAAYFDYPFYEETGEYTYGGCYDPKDFVLMPPERKALGDAVRKAVPKIEKAMHDAIEKAMR